MKKVISLLLAVLMLVSVVPMVASAETEGIYTYTITDEKATITAVDKNISGKVEIPESLGGYPVTAIGSEAFYKCENLEEVEIPGTVKSIGAFAFSYCPKLGKVTLNEGIESLGRGVFSKCESLVEITLPDSITFLDREIFSESAVETINYPLNLKDVGTLYSSGPLVNTNIKTVIIPEGVTEIVDSIFFNAKKLVNVNIPSTVTKIGADAFKNCESLKNIDIPESVTVIESGAFAGCTSLRTLVFPDSVTTLGAYVISGCINLKTVNYPRSLVSTSSAANGIFRGSFIETVTIPGEVKKIVDTSFMYSTSLKEVIIEEGVEEIGTNAFYYCIALTDIELPSTVKTIGASAFFDCTALERIKIPETVTSIASNTFSGCEDTLTVLCYSGSVAHQYCENAGINYILIDNHECDYELIKLGEPTCTEPGIRYYKCTLCDVEYNYEYSPANGHSLSYSTVTKPVKCGVDGEKRIDCDYCAYYETEVIKAPEHTNVTRMRAKPATCSSTGLTEGKMCEDCGVEIVAQQTIPKLPHVYGASVSNATCTANGQISYYCFCGDNYVEIIPTTGHDYQNGICTKCGDNKADGCSHLCHKGGFWYKLCLFFWKLFKTNKECSCGMYHY